MTKDKYRQKRRRLPEEPEEKRKKGRENQEGGLEFCVLGFVLKKKRQGRVKDGKSKQENRLRG